MQPIEDIIEKFAIEGRLETLKVNKQGHINGTFISTFDNNGKKERYTHQKVNKTVFPQPEKVMENIQNITGHIQKRLEQQQVMDRSRRCLELVKTRDGLAYAYDETGELWRTYRFIDEVAIYSFLDDENVAYQFGKAVGTFQLQLSDFPAETLHTPIAYFHDMQRRYAQLRQAMAENRANRLDTAQAEIAFLLQQEECGCRVSNALRAGKVPLRVTHNDTKVNNVLFDPVTNEGICVIDLDTVMPGTILFDTGDMLRTGCITAAEDETDLEKVLCDEVLFIQMVKGYLSTAEGFLTEGERLLVPESGRATTQIMAVRFLTDYLNGDVYYQVEREKHNLDRCRTQLELIRDMDRKWRSILSQLGYQEY